MYISKNNLIVGSVRSQPAGVPGWSHPLVPSGLERMSDNLNVPVGIATAGDNWICDGIGSILGAAPPTGATPRRLLLPAWCAGVDADLGGRNMFRYFRKSYGRDLPDRGRGSRAADASAGGCPDPVWIAHRHGHRPAEGGDAWGHGDRDQHRDGPRRQRPSRTRPGTTPSATWCPASTTCPRCCRGSGSCASAA